MLQEGPDWLIYRQCSVCAMKTEFIKDMLREVAPNVMEQIFFEIGETVKGKKF
jgi:hypothetical protein